MRGPFEHNQYAVPFRRLYCVHYGQCLDQAVRLDWKSWDCTGCDVQEELTPQQKYEQMFSLLELLGEVHGNREVPELWAPEPGDPKEA